MPTQRDTDAAVIQLAAEMHGMVNGQAALRVLTELRDARNRIAELETEIAELESAAE
jgi:hypothetical protein